MVRRLPALRRVVEKPLEESDLVLVGPQPLEELSRVIECRLLLLRGRDDVVPGDHGSGGGCGCGGEARPRLAVANNRREGDGDGVSRGRSEGDGDAETVCAGG
ncbi:hypothetical protein PanWU01x14_054520 [Parasponia andersonii]|uniref:Uncharacterized protein n=1 Tax=Parasponia andersonii TaxID=3476 RepID=A0A2P5DKS9_PARAD|nr:hypothetical protein PanWU01x14_054520 [Parasponia andersonii]